MSAPRMIPADNAIALMNGERSINNLSISQILIIYNKLIIILLVVNMQNPYKAKWRNYNMFDALQDDDSWLRRVEILSPPPRRKQDTTSAVATADATEDDGIWLGCLQGSFNQIALMSLIFVPP